MFNFLKPKLTIATHSSKFHTDDIFAVATLLLVLEKEGKSARVVRTRDMEIIKTANYVVDVGGIYDSEKNLFDHHQIGGAGKRDDGIPYASFGLVWEKYGEKLSGSREVATRIDNELVQIIDAYDNGVDLVDLKNSNIRPFDTRDLLYIFRPTWKENKNLDDVFMEIVFYAKVILKRIIICKNDELDAERLVEEAYRNAADKRVLILDERYPWEDVIIKKYSETLFVIYPKRVDNTWSLKTVRQDGRMYISRKNLPETWAGQSGDSFEKITGVEGAIFCHKNLFLAVAKTKEAILKLAEIALNS